MSKCIFHSVQAIESSKLLKSLEETKDCIRSTGQRCYLVRPEVGIPIKQISLLQILYQLVMSLLMVGSIINCCFFFHDSL